MLLRFNRIFHSFITSESFSGIFLFSCAVLAMIIANSPLKDIYHHAIEANIGLMIDSHFFGLSLHHWINDVLMAFFFLMVGLEIKRELIFGELNSFAKAAFPALAALGGMVVPALIYYGLNYNTNSSHGFGIPMATDIAFALGVAMILGKKFPLPLKVFLVTLAVVDDLGAILVIAVFYSNSLSLLWLGVSAGIVLLLFILNRLGVKSLAVYLTVGVFLWFSVHFSEIHATIAAVVLAFFIPIKSAKNYSNFKKGLKKLKDSNEEVNDGVLLDVKQISAINFLKSEIVRVENPLIKLEHALQPYCAYFIMPIFALANSGITINSSFNIHIDHIFLGIILGLLIGKPLGVFLITFLSEKIGIARRPDGITWTYIIGAGLLSGIGFTMSIFVSNLAFVDNESKDLAKVAVLIGSLIACFVGAFFIWLYSSLKKD